MKKKALLASLLAIGTLVLAGCGEEASETSEVAEESETSETVESTDSTESTESTESTDPIDSTDSTDGNDDDTGDNDDDTDDTDDTDDVEYEDGTVTLVTSASELAAGDQLVVTCLSKSAIMTSQSGNFRTYETLDYISEETTQFIYQGTGAIVTLVASTTTEGAWNLAVTDGYLYYTSSNNNSVNTGEDLYDWTITFDEEGTLSIATVEDSSRRLQWNASSPRFACYTSTQTAIQIFKARTYIEETVVEEEEVEDNYITEIAEGDYKFGLYQSGLTSPDWYFFTGSMTSNGYYFSTTTAYSEAADVTIALVDGGGFTMKVGDYYITTTYSASGNSTYRNPALSETEATVWYMADAANNYAIYTYNSASEQVYIGTYGTYTTLSVSLYSYAATSIPAHLYAADPTV